MLIRACGPAPGLAVDGPAGPRPTGLPARGLAAVRTVVVLAQPALMEVNARAAGIAAPPMNCRSEVPDWPKRAQAGRRAPQRPAPYRAHQHRSSHHGAAPQPWTLVHDAPRASLVLPQLCGNVGARAITTTVLGWRGGHGRCLPILPASACALRMGGLCWTS